MYTHRKRWQCVDGCDQFFSSRPAFQSHLQQIHADLYSEQRSLELIRTCERPAEMDAAAICALCQLQLPSLLQLGRHMGKHHEELALFALPTYLKDYDDEGDNERLSDGVRSYTSSVSLHRSSSPVNRMCGFCRGPLVDDHCENCGKGSPSLVNSAMKDSFSLSTPDQFPLDNDRIQLGVEGDVSRQTVVTVRTNERLDAQLEATTRKHLDTPIVFGPHSIFENEDRIPSSYDSAGEANPLILPIPLLVGSDSGKASVIRSVIPQNDAETQASQSSSLSKGYEEFRNKEKKLLQLYGGLQKLYTQDLLPTGSRLRVDFEYREATGKISRKEAFNYFQCYGEISWIILVLSTEPIPTWVVKFKDSDSCSRALAEAQGQLLYGMPMVLRPDDRTLQAYAEGSPWFLQDGWLGKLGWEAPRPNQYLEFGRELIYGPQLEAEEQQSPFGNALSGPRDFSANQQHPAFENIETQAGTPLLPLSPANAESTEEGSGEVSDFIITVDDESGSSYRLLGNSKADLENVDSKDSVAATRGKEPMSPKTLDSGEIGRAAESPTDETERQPRKKQKKTVKQNENTVFDGTRKWTSKNSEKSFWWFCCYCDDGPNGLGHINGCQLCGRLRCSNCRVEAG
ncbi:hypothetical protein BCR34DRAFT_276290 [Clohesyomyces aquaticus]|uniref:C2H2-type domain-containing protein n=1 Tax=Clohesyomyces aquaticus TaxID=1231657 RepID=A0A1Y1ZSG5_9PLEO|nr:hypothetical protein BCR34DRAFT_276290 [Clohesyomyces aquaticus]